MPSRPKPTRRPAPRAVAKKQKEALEKRLETLVSKKRDHRAKLSDRASSHWKLEGHRAKHAYLERVRSALEKEGFRSSLLQWRHKGHSYGLIKDLGDKQVHVRVYEDGVVDAELEIHKRYLEHLWSPRPSAHRIVQKIFQKHGIPIRFVNEKYLPQVGATRRAYPKMRTRVSHLLAASGAGLGIAGLYVARIYLSRMRRRLIA